MTCTRCKQDKHSDDFGSDKRMKSGKNIYCRECVRAASVLYREINPDKCKESAKKTRIKSREKKNEYTKKRYQENRDSILLDNKERRKNDYEKVLEIERASRAKNKEKQRPFKNERQMRRTRIQKEKSFLILPKELKKLYSQPCLFCNSKENQSIDHVIPLSRGGNHSIGNLITLCRSCNSRKGNKFMVEYMKTSKSLSKKGCG
jgi:5-methylcytosine-specific restriction endonuclease McrA